MTHICPKSTNMTIYAGISAIHSMAVCWQSHNKTINKLNVNCIDRNIFYNNVGWYVI